MRDTFPSPAQDLKNMSDLTEVQQAALDKMREMFAGVDGVGMRMDDRTLLRYLRARSYDFNKASAMLQATLAWRTEFGLNDISSWRDVMAIENSTGKTYVRGYTKDGHVILIMRPAKENTNDHDGNIKNLIYTMERAVACSEKLGQEKLLLVIDYQNYSLFNAPPMKTSRQVLSILQDHYPERLLRACLVRPPMIFYAFYKMISPFVDRVTSDKVCMLTNADMNNANNQLYQVADRAMLEAVFGGEDSRPFDSPLYLDGPFDEEYNTILSRVNGDAVEEKIT